MIADIVNIVTQQIIAKSIVEEKKIPYKYYAKIQPLTRSIQNISDLGSEFNTKNPFTYYKTMNKVVNYFVAPDINPVKPDKVYQYLDKQEENGVLENITRIPGHTIANSLIKTILKHDEYPKKIIKTSDKHQLMSLEFAKDKFLYILGHANNVEIVSDEEDKLSQDQQDELRFYNFYLEVKHIDESLYFIMSHIWRKNECLQLTNGTAGGLAFNKFSPSERDYIGDLDLYTESIKKFFAHNIKRTIMFQGIPGTGKTTLCATLHKKLSKKTIYVDMECIRSISNNDWFFIMKYTRPTLVIIEDIDRNFNALNLSMIEEPHYRVPLTLFTANAQANMPMAYRRPGRIDQIIDMEAPNESQRWMRVEEFAKIENIPLEDITESAQAELIRCITTHSESHVVELLRRYKVEGWDYQIPTNDISFGEGMNRKSMQQLTHVTEII